MIEKGRHSAKDIFKCIFINENIWISIEISLKPAFVQMVAWRRPGYMPLSEPMMVSLLTHIGVIRASIVPRRQSSGALQQLWTLTQMSIKAISISTGRPLQQGCILLRRARSIFWREIVFGMRNEAWPVTRPSQWSLTLVGWFEYKHWLLSVSLANSLCTVTIIA